MKIGMTGTRKGMTKKQKAEFEAILLTNNCTELHHGDCVGADKDAHKIAVSLGIRTVIHPPIKKALRAYCVGDEFRDEKDYFVRNRNIVDETNMLIGTPSSMTDKRGGTWYTIKYATKKGGVVEVLSP